MMSVRIEFDYPQETGENRTFSLSITGMGIGQVGEIVWRAYPSGAKSVRYSTKKSM